MLKKRRLYDQALRYSPLRACRKKPQCPLNRRHEVQKRKKRHKCKPTPSPHRCHRCNVDIVSGTRTLFHEQQFLNVSFRGAHVLPVQDTSVASVISYAVKNKGASSLSAALEISPNGIDFTEDAVATIDAGALKVIVPNRFLRWTRVRLTSAHREKAAADVYYQDQTLGISREGH